MTATPEIVYPFVHVDATGAERQFEPVHVVNGHIGGARFSNEQWRTRAVEGYSVDALAAFACVAFAGRHPGLVVQKLEVAPAVDGWHQLTLKFGPAAETK
jgi:hypothetical protein